MDVDAIDAVMQRFPLWFYEQLRAQRFILPDEAVTFVVKRKSRKVGVGNYKISYHFIVEIAGTPVWHRAVCNSIFYSFAADIKQIQSSKSVAHLSDDQILLPAYYCDIATLHGNQGFATLYSQKKVEDPRAFLVCRVAFRNGGEVARREFSQGSDDPTGPKAIEHLVHGCFTVPTCYVANYVASVGVMVRVVFFSFFIIIFKGSSGIEPQAYMPCFQAIPKQMPGGTTKKGSSNSALRPHGRGSGSGAPPDLPSWVESLLQGHGGISGCVWTTTYPCLSRYMESFKSGLGLEEVTCVHVKNFLCPLKLCQEKKPMVSIVICMWL